MARKSKRKITTGRKNISKGRDIWNRMTRNVNAVIGMVIVVILVFVAVFADKLVDYETMVIKPNILERLQQPSGAHLLGTDELGRDVLARLIYGSRMSLLIGVLAVVFAMIMGIIAGSAAGYFGGTVDMIIMRVCDMLDSVPSFLLAITITAAFGTSLFNLMLAIGLGSFPGQVRIIRGQILTIRNEEYVEAGRAMGARSWQIIGFHILPNCIAVIIVQFTLKIAGGILTASTLSFLGLGVQPPNPEWGAMLSGGRTYLLDNSYLTLYPGLCIMITILAFNMMGDGLRDALDPRLKR
jgi:peptide/nickel transport system permease protein